MDLGGGTGDLKSILLDYLCNLVGKKKSPKPFKHKPLTHPVILVLDNDDGLETVARTVKKVFGVLITATSTDDFYHVTENLYLIKTPETNGSSCIEDLFPDELKDTRLKGKKFNATGKIDPQTEYGKEIFAKSVVKPNSHNIDFSGFDPLLDRTVAVLDDYYRA